MGCMNPLPEDRESCGICGYPAKGQNPAGYLPVETALSDRYVCGRALSVTGDAVVYMGWDKVAKQPVYIREYLPTTICKRTEINALEPNEGMEMTYEGLRQSFLQHARLLARNRELAVLAPTYDIFEQNGTAYTVSEYSTGITLRNYVKKCGGKLSWMEARKLFLPFLTAVAACHAAGIYHYAISPDTVIIGSDGKLHLNAFALPEARSAGSRLAAQLVTGFAAPEQYMANGHLSQATDVYGLGATLFWMLSGVTPPNGETRDPDGQDLMMSEDVVNALPDDVTAALVNSLLPASADRFESVESLRDALGGVAQVESYEAEPTVVKDENYLPKKFRWIFGGVIAALVIALVLSLLFGGTGGAPSEDPSTTSSTSKTLPSMTTTASTSANANSKEVPDLMGKDLWTLEEKDYKYFNLELNSMVFNEKPAGTIIDQQPKATDKAAEGTMIQVIISAGPQTKKVPDVKGWDKEIAQKYLEAMGFKIEIMEIAVSEYEAGKVDGVSPEIGVTAEHGDKLTLRVSTVEKPNKTEVMLPDVSNIPAEFAGQILRSLGLTVSTEEVLTTDAAQQGLVESVKDRMTGAMVAQGDEVVLRVYSITAGAPVDGGEPAPQGE